MLIKYIKLKNFRQFKGEHKINFSTDKEKNVTIVMGDNGSGKTTLEQAFLWCLYGQNNFQNKGLLNLEIENTRYATVEVELYIEHHAVEYKIKRIQSYRRTNFVWEPDVPQVFLDIRNTTGGWDKIDATVIRSKLNRIMAEQLSQFFFFDGEHLSDMSKELFEKKKSNNFRDAVRGLVGLAALEAAVTHFGKKPGPRSITVISRFNKEIDESGVEELGKLTNLIEDLEARAGNVDRELKLAEENIDISNKELGEVETKLALLNDDVDRKREYEALNKKIKENEQRKTDNINGFFKLFGNQIGLYYSQNVIGEVLEELRDFDVLDKGVPGIHSDTVAFLLKRNICICGEKISDSESRIKHLKELELALPPHSIGNSISIFSAGVKTAMDGLDGFTLQKNNYLKNYRSCKEEIRRAEVRRSEIEESLSDVNEANALRQRRNKANTVLKEAKESRGRLSIQLESLQRDINHNKKKRDDLAEQDTRTSLNKKYLTYAEAVYEVLKEVYEEKENKIRDELQQTINKIFSNIYDGEILLRVDEKYRVSTQIRNMDSSLLSGDVDRNTAQNYAIIFAFIAGIIEMAKKKRGNGKNENVLCNTKESYPLVMDAPLSSFDKTRIANICQSLPDIAEQFILFIKDTDGDIAEKHLANRIGARYKILPISKAYSNIERKC